jgi:hypothetical protein
MRRRTAGGFAILLVACLGMSAPRGPRAQAGAASAQQPSAYARFAFGGNAAEVPADFIGNRIFLPVRVNQSQPSLFEVDSTAASSSIDPGRAAELGIAPGQSAVLGMEGVSLSVPALPFLAKPDFSAHVGREYEGTLGRDFLGSVVVEIDYARRTVRLYDPGTFQYSGRGKTLPLKFIGGAPVVQAKFNAGDKTIEGAFILNTALDVPVVISNRYPETHRSFTRHTRTIPAIDEQPDWAEGDTMARLDSFQIGPYSVGQAIAEFSRRSLTANDPHLVGEIGGGMLRRFAVTLDFPRQQVILNSNSDFHAYDEADMSGVSITASGPGLKRFEVTDVKSGTPGAAAGIQKGDVITGIDDEPAADLSLVEIRTLFRQITHPYKLLLDRNGQTVTVILKLHRLL